MGHFSAGSTHTPENTTYDDFVVVFGFLPDRSGLSPATLRVLKRYLETVGETNSIDKVIFNIPIGIISHFQSCLRVTTISFLCIT